MGTKKKTTKPEYGMPTVTVNVCDGTMVELSELSPWPGNPRTIGQPEKSRLTRQLAEMGLFRPLLVRSHDDKLTVLGGNQRYLILQQLASDGKLTLKHNGKATTMVPCTILTNISDLRAREIVLADNNSAGAWDYSLLRDFVTVEEGLDLALAGFEDDLAASLNHLASDPEAILSELAGNDDLIERIASDDLDDAGTEVAWSQPSTDGEPPYDPHELVGISIGPQRHKVRAETYHRLVQFASKVAKPTWSFDRVLNEVLDLADAPPGSPPSVPSHRKDHGKKTTKWSSAKKPEKAPAKRRGKQAGPKAADPST